MNFYRDNEQKAYQDEPELCPDGTARPHMYGEHSPCGDKDDGFQRNENIRLRQCEDTGLQRGENAGLRRSEDIGLRRGEDVSLRPHHCICILNYAGKGYSEEFTENMERVINELDAGTVIELKCASDCVCIACKNRVEKSQSNLVGCFFAEKVSRYDKKLLETLDFSEGDRVTWGELREKVVATVMNERSSLDDICGDCEWFCICSENCGRL